MCVVTRWFALVAVIALATAQQENNVTLETYMIPTSPIDEAYIAANFTIDVAYSLNTSSGRIQLISLQNATTPNGNSSSNATSNVYFAVIAFLPVPKKNNSGSNATATPRTPLQLVTALVELLKEGMATNNTNASTTAYFNFLASYGLFDFSSRALATPTDTYSVTPTLTLTPPPPTPTPPPTLLTPAPPAYVPVTPVVPTNGTFPPLGIASTDSTVLIAVIIGILGGTVVVGGFVVFMKMVVLNKKKVKSSAGGYATRRSQL